MSFESSLKKIIQNSLWVYSVRGACCSDEFENCFGARYDLERFGVVKAGEPENADVLVVSGAITYPLAREIKIVYEKMREPRFVMALGSCTISGGIFSPDWSYAVVPGLDRVLPVDVHVPGCPPRPEAIQEGWIKLQERVHGRTIQRTL